MARNLDGEQREKIRSSVSCMKGLLINLCPHCRVAVERLFDKYFGEIEDALKG